MVALIMQRTSLAQGLMIKARNNPDIRLYFEPDYGNANEIVIDNLTDGVLMEVSEDGIYNISFCLTLCARLRKKAPNCRLMLMCSEGQKEAVSCAIEAKLRGEIDDFVFCDVSLDYFVACLESL